MNPHDSYDPHDLSAKLMAEVKATIAARQAKWDRDERIWRRKHFFTKVIKQILDLPLAFVAYPEIKSYYRYDPDSNFLTAASEVWHYANKFVAEAFWFLRCAVMFFICMAIINWPIFASALIKFTNTTDLALWFIFVACWIPGSMCFFVCYFGIGRKAVVVVAPSSVDPLNRVGLADPMGEARIATATEVDRALRGQNAGSGVRYFED